MTCHDDYLRQAHDFIGVVLLSFHSFWWGSIVHVIHVGTTAKPFRALSLTSRKGCGCIMHDFVFNSECSIRSTAHPGDGPMWNTSAPILPAPGIVQTVQSCDPQLHFNLHLCLCLQPILRCIALCPHRIISTLKHCTIDPIFIHAPVLYSQVLHQSLLPAFHRHICQSNLHHHQYHQRR